MPNSIAAWEQQQWGVFVAVIAAGLLAAVLAPPVARVRADYRAARPKPRHVVPAHLAALYPRHALPVVPGLTRTDQDDELIGEIEAHLAAGPGSLLSLREVGPGHIAEPEPLVDADVRADLDAALSAALEAFRVAVEPAMRKARLWTLQAGETYAENALRTWHLLEQTAEYPIVRRVLDASSTEG
jgi:hypothetical protein